MVEGRAQSEAGDGSSCTIAIVGGGFSGVSLAAQLLRDDDLASVVIIEKGSSKGRGLAYGTECHSLLLNVRARNMSAFVDDPLHFLRWARSNYDPTTKSESFLPRAVYGRYLEAFLESARASAGRLRLRWISAEAVAVEPAPHGGMEVQLGNGLRLLAERVVLAQGNFPARDPLAAWEMKNDSRYFCNPWAPEIFEGTDRLNNILLIGSGLTSIDVAVQLRVHRCRGTIHVLSHRGLFPQPHKATDDSPSFWNEYSPKTIRGLLRLVRQEVRQAEEMGIEWQGVLDSLRPQVPRIWQSLPDPERRRFLRHVRSYWEIHRHRAAPEIAGAIEKEIAEGLLLGHSGRIAFCRSRDDRIEAAYLERKTGHRKSLHVDRIINCTGPESDYRRLEDPLVKSLVASGLARPDPLFLGLDTTEDGAVIGQRGIASDTLYAVGPSRKSGLWESTAVPELRLQTYKLAGHLLGKVAMNVC
jgi:uncharacterized NAD(P)/FAD-binding protein YdhS